MISLINVLTVDPANQHRLLDLLVRATHEQLLGPGQRERWRRLDREMPNIRAAIDHALGDGIRTADLGGEHATEEATRAVLAHL